MLFSSRPCTLEAVSITRLPRSYPARQGHVLVWRLHPGLPENPWRPGEEYSFHYNITEPAKENALGTTRSVGHGPFIAGAKPIVQLILKHDLRHVTRYSKSSRFTGAMRPPAKSRSGFPARGHGDPIPDRWRVTLVSMA